MERSAGSQTKAIKMEFINSQVPLSATSRAAWSTWQAALFLGCIQAHLPQFHSRHPGAGCIISWSLLQLLDTFVSPMKRTRMPRLLPLGNFFISQGLLSGHKNYWVSLAVDSQTSLEEGLASHPLSTPDLSLQTLRESYSCKSAAKLM